MKIYEVYMVELDGIGSEQKGNRPAVIVSNDLNNIHSPTITIIPITSQTKNNLPTHCFINGLPKPSYALAEQIRTIDKGRVDRYIKTLTSTEISELQQCIKIQLNL